MTEIIYRKENTSKLWLAESIGVVLTFIMSGLVKIMFTATEFIPFAVISPVNNSVWEHLKIIVSPFVIYSIIEYIAVKPFTTRYINAKSSALISIMVVNAAVYYTICYIIPANTLIVDIITALTFILASVISYKQYFSDKNSKPTVKLNYFTVVIMLVILISFGVFTFITPHLKIFTDPATETYGISTYYVNKLISLLQELQ